MNAASRLEEKKAAVEHELDRLLAGGDLRLFEALRYAVLSGGKRFRPLLLLASGESFSGEWFDLLPFACALELIHSYSLIHDDLPCMDDDDFRRGRPSCHKAFGEGSAVLAGDALLTLAFEVLADAPAAAGPFQKGRAVKEISKAAGIRGMIQGQWLDINFSPGTVTEESYYDLIFKKTGALIVASVKAGAILGGADDAQLAAIEDYGRNLSLAFQLRDDLLDSAKEAEAVLRNRPNAVLLFGIEGTEKRLAYYLEKAIGALDGASIRSEELRFLSNRFLDSGRNQQYE